MNKVLEYLKHLQRENTSWGHERNADRLQQAVDAIERLGAENELLRRESDQIKAEKEQTMASTGDGYCCVGGSLIAIDVREWQKLQDTVEHLRDNWNKGQADVERLRAELERLHTWDGLLSLLDEHYPPDVVDGSSGDPRIVALMREIARLRVPNFFWDDRHLLESGIETIGESVAFDDPGKIVELRPLHELPTIFVLVTEDGHAVFDSREEAEKAAAVAKEKG